MSRRHRLLIAIETNELRFWNLTERVLVRVRLQSTSLGARVDEALDDAIAWAGDAARARREEIAFLTRRAVGAVPTAGAASRPSAASNGDAILVT